MECECCGKPLRSGRELKRRINNNEGQKVAIVTGANKGIGFAIVKGLAKTFNGDLYLTSRNEARGLSAVKELSDEGIKVLYHQLDIDDESSIVKFAGFIKGKYGSIDILINNAAIAFKNAATEPFALQAKITLQTNYFNTKLTCEQLFPLLNSGARVVNLSSSSGYLLRIPSDDLKRKFASSDSTLTVQELDAMIRDFIESADAGNHVEKGWPNSTYVVSKVGLSALSRIQQREIDQDISRKDIVINHVHPGYVDTDMTSHKGPLTPEQGAMSSLFAANLPSGTDVKGQYIWYDCSIVDWVTGKWTIDPVKPKKIKRSRWA